MANCNPGTRQYIGARYVPRHMGEWSADTQYSALDVVLYTDGNSYTAKCYPPKGAIPTDDKYWSLSAQFNQQLANIGDKVDRITAFKTPYQYGAKGDGITDDTDAFISMLENGGVILLTCGTFNVSNDLSIESNTTIVGNGGVVALKNTARVIVDTVSNVILDSVNIVGNIDDFSTDPNKSVVTIRSSEFVEVKNCFIKNSRTDGIIVERLSGKAHCKNVKIYNNYIYNAARNGIAIADCINCQVYGNTVDTVVKFVPYCGIDIEPNYPDDAISGVILESNVTKKCAWHAVNFSTLRTGEKISVKCNNHLSIGDAGTGTPVILLYNNHKAEEAITVDSNSGLIDISNFTALSSTGWPIFVKGNKSTNDVVLKFKNGYMETAYPTIQFYPDGENEQGGIEIGGEWKNSNSVLQFRSMANAVYKNIRLEANVNITKDGTIGEGSDIRAVYPYNMVDYDVNTLVFNGENGEVQNQYGDNLKIEKSGTGDYKLTGGVRGYVVSAYADVFINSQDNGRITLTNKEGEKIDATIMIIAAIPATVGIIKMDRKL